VSIAPHDARVVAPGNGTELATRFGMTRMASRPLLTLAVLSFACALSGGCSSGDDDSAPCKDCVYPATGGSSPSPVPTDQQVGSGQQAPPNGNTGGDNGTGGSTSTGGTGGTGGTVGGAFGGTGGTDSLTAGGTVGFGGNGGTVASGGSGGTVGNTLTGGTTGSGATGGI
jgi:hypothetical protein